MSRKDAGDDAARDIAQAEGRSRRGFASMDEDVQRSIASKGGKAAHAQGRAHEFTSDEAKKAGLKGGQTIGKNREHMARIGRLGGLARKHHKVKRT